MLGAFILIGLLPFLIVGAVSYNGSKTALRQQAFGQLRSVLQVKKQMARNFFDELETDITVLVDELESLYKNAAEKLSATQSSHVNEITGFLKNSMANAENMKYGILKRFTAEYGYRDLMLIDKL